jgi:hypothetical protein
MSQNMAQFTNLPWYTYLNNLLKNIRVVINIALMTTTGQAVWRPDCQTAIAIYIYICT